MKPCGILDGHKLMKVLDGDELVVALSDLRLPHSLSSWFVNDSIAVNYRYVGNTIYSVHVYSKKRKQMKRVAEFVYEAGLYMEENFGLTTALSTVSRDQKQIKFILKLFNSEKIYEDTKTAIYAVRRYE